MSLEAFYARIDGDYDGVKGRLLTDERIAKFAKLFFDDATYDTLVSTLEAGDLEGAFRAAHTMKGVANDLGFRRIAAPASELADALRPDEAGIPAAPEKAPELMEQVSAAYVEAVEAKALID